MATSNWDEFNRLKRGLVEKYGHRPTAGFSQGYTAPTQKKQKIRKKKHRGKKPQPIIFYGYNTAKG